MKGRLKGLLGRRPKRVPPSGRLANTDLPRPDAPGERGATAQFATEEATSRRIDGSTPAGGAYQVAHFLHDGRPVPQRFANTILIVENDDSDHEISSTLGHTTPKAVLPRDFSPDVAASFVADHPL